MNQKSRNLNRKRRRNNQLYLKSSSINNGSNNSKIAKKLKLTENTDNSDSSIRFFRNKKRKEWKKKKMLDLNFSKIKIKPLLSKNNNNILGSRYKKYISPSSPGISTSSKSNYPSNVEFKIFGGNHFF